MLALSESHAAKSARNTELNAKRQSAAISMPDLACMARTRLALGKVSVVHDTPNPQNC